MEVGQELVMETPVPLIDQRLVQLDYVLGILELAEAAEAFLKGTAGVRSLNHLDSLNEDIIDTFVRYVAGFYLLDGVSLKNCRKGNRSVSDPAFLPTPQAWTTFLHSQDRISTSSATTPRNRAESASVESLPVAESESMPSAVNVRAVMEYTD